MGGGGFTVSGNGFTGGSRKGGFTGGGVSRKGGFTGGFTKRGVHVKPVNPPGYGPECCTVSNAGQKKIILNNKEMRMLRWNHGISLKDHVRSDEIRNRAKIKRIVAHVTKRILDWCGHIRRIYPEDHHKNGGRQG